VIIWKNTLLYSKVRH